MKRRSAFTLIELLVVIAIIALLVSILMPSLQKAKEMAKNVVCMSNQKTVSHGIFLYCNQYDDQYPYEVNRRTINGDAFAPNIDWRVRIGIIDDDQMPDYFDPNTPHERIAKEGFVEYNWYNWYVRSDGPFKCPTAIEQVFPKPPPYWPDETMGAGWGSCFSMNQSLSLRCNEEMVGDKEVDVNARCAKLTDVKTPAVMIADGSTRYASIPHIFIRSRFVQGGEDGKLGYDWQTPEQAVEWYGPWPLVIYVDGYGRDPADWKGHPGKRANVCWTDGHVESAGTGNIDAKDWNIH